MFSRTNAMAPRINFFGLFGPPNMEKGTMMMNSQPSDGARSATRMAVQILNRLIDIRPLGGELLLKLSVNFKGKH